MFIVCAIRCRRLITSISSRDYAISSSPPFYPFTAAPQSRARRAAYRFVLVKCPCLKDRNAKLHSKSTRPIGRLKKKRLSSQYALQKVKTLRRAFDQAGAQDKTLLIALD